jgi:hypothetical protein
MTPQALATILTDREIGHEITLATRRSRRHE